MKMTILCQAQTLVTWMNSQRVQAREISEYHIIILPVEIAKTQISFIQTRLIKMIGHRSRVIRGAQRHPRKCSRVLNLINRLRVRSNVTSNSKNYTTRSRLVKINKRRKIHHKRLTTCSPKPIIKRRILKFRHRSIRSHSRK